MLNIVFILALGDYFDTAVFAAEQEGPISSQWCIWPVSK